MAINKPKISEGYYQKFGQSSAAGEAALARVARGPNRDRVDPDRIVVQDSDATTKFDGGSDSDDDLNKMIYFPGGLHPQN